MKISKNWLLEWVNPKKSTEQICAQLTAAGLEVDLVVPVAPAFSGVVVAEIVTAVQHPDADKLQVCQVNDGKHTLQIVCGAKNARAGLKVALATVGAVLPGDFKISKAKLRGAESNGMLCSLVELGLAETSDGIVELPNDAPVGQDIRLYLQLDDEVIDIDLTPNRGDCLSIKGIARELSVVNQIPVTEPVIADVIAQGNTTFPVKINAAQACPRYCTRVINQVNVATPSPLWLVEKLRRGGVRSINPVVDITNYVTLELGQPMHAFDLATLVGGIVVRFANKAEQLALLDNQTVELNEATLVIADHNKALAIAGVMGGSDSGVHDSTHNIVLESAFFDPLIIMGTGRRYNVHTDSSYRFERGVDPSITLLAMQRATALILEICGGVAGPINEVVHEKYLPQAKIIILRRDRLTKLLGYQIADDKVEGILSRLGLQLTPNAAGWSVVTPSHRFDLALEEDLIEEVARIYGYDHIPSTVPVDTLNMLPKSEHRYDLHLLRHSWVERGYQETLSYSFIDPAIQELFFPTMTTISLQNPIASNLSVMRTSLWPSLVTAVVHNQKHQQERVRLFEIGRVFHARNNNVEQSLTLSGVATGSRYTEQWAEKQVPIDFYDVKGDLQAVLPQLTFMAAEHSALHPGQTAQIFLGQESVGWLGTLHPRLSQKLKLASNVVLFELDLAHIAQKLVPQYQQLSKYPTIRRDLAIMVAEKVTFQQVYDIVGNSAGKLLCGLDIFDVYRGAGVGTERKSMAIKLILQHQERTLVDQEVTELMQQVISDLQSHLQAELRE